MLEVVDISEKGAGVSGWRDEDVGKEKPLGLSMEVWNSSFFSGSLMLGERWAWWIGWVRRT